MDTNEHDSEVHEPNSYFEAFAGIAAALDALAKAVTPDEDDDGTPADEGERPCCNSYFTSFKNIVDALGRLKTATEERLAALTEKDPNFTAWREAYSIAIGANSKTISNSVAIGASAACGAATGSNARDTGAVAIGRVAQAYGHCAMALGKGARAGADGNRTTLPTVQLGAGANENDGSLQFRDWQVVDATGKIPSARMPDGIGTFDFASPPVGTGGVISLVDRAVNAVSLTGGTLVLSPPASIAGKARSFVVRLTMAAETDWSFPSGVNFESDDEGVFGDIETGATATFFFTEVSENRFLVARKDTATVTKG